ncbi:hypothetical protein HUF18_16210 [Thalassolituus sp. ST750PaO-4]|uniref:hypothetical protein n=1 Tax=Thalassolituus sp. ST750PaO-4 TaxID=2742965 RepID=UPI001CE360C6|nr:hypothetical protein [Thalassolituus sp. ST750PaO-4]MCA6061326.1 hypothetical protein [Thalassolituus sp. ST750PaO-4]
MKRKLFFCMSVLAISGCNSDGVQDKDLDEQMLREALCIIAAERFQLYDEAEHHLQHGLEAGRRKAIRTGEPNEFREYIELVKQYSSTFSKEDSARDLKEKCDRRLTMIEFSRV